jgi:hypothetical protein
MSDEVKQTLVIERAKWLRGEGGSVSQLLRASDGKMCCLGFLGAQCGYAPDQLRGHAEPGELFGRWETADYEKNNLWPCWLLHVDEYGATDGADLPKLIATNDDRLISDQTREADIASIFAKHGVTVIFK